MKASGILPDNLHDDMSDSITRLTEVYEEVDNLALTVIPFAYLQATRLTQFLFCLALPFVVFEQQDVQMWHMVVFSPLILMIKCVPPPHHWEDARVLYTYSTHRVYEFTHAGS